MSARTITCYVVVSPKTYVNPMNRFRVVAFDDVIEIANDQMRPDELASVGDRFDLESAIRVRDRYNTELGLYKTMVDPERVRFEGDI